MFTWNGGNKMSYRHPTFTINLYDKEGDIIDEGIFLHYGDVSILIADTFEEFKKHNELLKNIEEEIFTNYGGLKHVEKI
jgi:hypothetical protein